MKKRTMLLGSLLAASVANAGPADNAQYLKENTGLYQQQAAELCLKVDVMTIASMGPNGGVSSPIGLQVASNTSPRDLVILPNRDTGDCETGYIKITTTAPLGSIRNAPAGL